MKYKALWVQWVFDCRNFGEKLKKEMFYWIYNWKNILTASSEDLVSVVKVVC